ncbi:MAG: hypothetical protein NTZ05_22200 [Chloroflexi bacterium]|nr:hypothetical protein [Chloroflexota bacterium]
MNRRWLAGAGSVMGAGLAAAGALLMTGTTVPANAALALAPSLAAPSNGAMLSNFNPTLGWELPPGATQYQLQVVPFGNDGPGIALIRSAEERFVIPAPPTWYVLLPDMSYTWQVRVSDAAASIRPDDPSWGPWSETRTFRTPRVTALSLTAADPPPGGTVTGFRPTLTWSTSDPNLWYFEIQVSTDPNFETRPEKAVAAVYWELKHGDPGLPNVTPFSYTIPENAPLQVGQTYYWRVRPRIQGDGTEPPWGQNNRFTTPSAGSVYLDVNMPQDETLTETATLTVTGTARPGSMVSVVGPADMNQVIAGSDGTFSIPVQLDLGPNQIDVLATDVATGETVAISRFITYSP